MNKKWQSEITPYYLTCSHVGYYDPIIDKDVFFHWLYCIDSIVHLYGSASDLYLHLQSDVLPSEDFFKILILFKRYQINTRQLIPYITDETIDFFVKHKKKTLLYHLLSYKGTPPKKQTIDPISRSHNKKEEVL